MTLDEIVADARNRWRYEVKKRKRLTRLEAATLRFFDEWSLPFNFEGTELRSNKGTLVAVCLIEKQVGIDFAGELNRAFAARDKRRKR